MTESDFAQKDNIVCVCLCARACTPYVCFLCVQDFQPTIYMTDADFANITNNGALCDSNGELGPSEFEDMMRKQIAELIQGKLILDRVRSPQVQ